MIYNNDCYEIFKKYEDGYFDTILTDPPYGMNFQSNWSKSGPLHDKTDDGTSGIVFDPFMGTGSTGVAAKQVNREFVGIELKQEYFNTAKERMND